MSVSYKLLNDMDGVERGALIRTKDGVVSVIPNCPDNRDYMEYQEWLAADPENQPEPAE